MKFNVQMCLCPECKSSGVVERSGKFGRFYTCDNKTCDWKVSFEKMKKMIENEEIKEMTQEELLAFLLNKNK